MKGEYTVKQQAGEWGYYAGIALEAQDCEPGQAGVHFKVRLSSPFQIAVQFGIEYALQHAAGAGRRPRPLLIEVVATKTNPVDTTLVVLAYAAMHATWEMLGEAPRRQPEIRAEEGIFLLPK